MIGQANKNVKKQPNEEGAEGDLKKQNQSALDLIKKARKRVLVIWQIELDFPSNVVSRYSFVVILLLAVLISTALSVVYSSHYSRELFHELKLKKQAKEDLETEWGQLLLEQSALSAHTRVESAADKYLNMMLPEAKDIKLVFSDGR